MSVGAAFEPRPGYSIGCRTRSRKIAAVERQIPVIDFKSKNGKVRATVLMDDSHDYYVDMTVKGVHIRHLRTLAGEVVGALWEKIRTSNASGGPGDGYEIDSEDEEEEIS